MAQLALLESHTIRPLEAADCRTLAAALGDPPNTTIEVHALMRGLARAFVLGSPSHFLAAVVAAGNLPAEPHGFADHASSLCDLLEQVQGWNCVLVESTSLLTRLLENTGVAQFLNGKGRTEGGIPWRQQPSFSPTKYPAGSIYRRLRPKRAYWAETNELLPPANEPIEMPPFTDCQVDAIESICTEMATRLGVAAK